MSKWRQNDHTTVYYLYFLLSDYSCLKTIFFPKQAPVRLIKLIPLALADRRYMAQSGWGGSCGQQITFMERFPLPCPAFPSPGVLLARLMARRRWNMTRLSAPNTNERINPSNAAFGQTWPTSRLRWETMFLCAQLVYCKYMFVFANEHHAILFSHLSWVRNSVVITPQSTRRNTPDTYADAFGNPQCHESYDKSVN